MIALPTVLGMPVSGAKLALAGEVMRWTVRSRFWTDIVWQG